MNAHFESRVSSTLAQGVLKLQPAQSVLPALNSACSPGESSVIRKFLWYIMY